MNDLEFVQSCVKGDKQAWDQFIDKYSRLIYSYIHKVLSAKGPASLQGQAGDIFQEIIYSLIKDNFKKLKSFTAKNGCSLASWLRQVAINYTIDYVRKLRPTVSIDEEAEDGGGLKNILAAPLAAAPEVLSQEEHAAHLKDCIERLDLDAKLFLELHINKGIRLEDLKGFLKISRGAIDMYKARILDKLRDCFRSKGFAIA